MFKKLRKHYVSYCGSRFWGERGLTLIEVLVTASLIVFISTLVIRNISISKLNLERLAGVVVADVRLAQSLALSTKKTEDQIRCGYGISQINSTTYVVYAGPPTTSNCASKNYNTSQESITYKTVVLDPRADLVDSPKFSDVFYEPPDPKTTIVQGGSSVVDIIIKKLGTTKQTCNNFSVDCIHVCVYDSGRVEVTRGPNCP